MGYVNPRYYRGVGIFTLDCLVVECLRSLFALGVTCAKQEIERHAS